MFQDYKTSVRFFTNEDGQNGFEFTLLAKRYLRFPDDYFVSYDKSTDIYTVWAICFGNSAKCLKQGELYMYANYIFEELERMGFIKDVLKKLSYKANLEWVVRYNHTFCIECDRELDKINKLDFE